MKSLRLKSLTLPMLAMLLGCGPTIPSSSTQLPAETLSDARKGFTTNIVRQEESAGPTDIPPEDVFKIVQYESPVGLLDAYVSPDPGDDQKHPAIIWITGGDNNSIGQVWGPVDRTNDQAATAFREAGILMMFPSQRGGNDNPGQREGFYGEVDDVLAAADYLEQLPYVDPQQIYLGGHSTGGTLVMLIAEMTNRFKATFSLGPVASPIQYGGMFIYCDTNNEQEVKLRSPIYWLNSVNTPLFVFEGAVDGNWDAIQQMADINGNSAVRFYNVPGHDHFSVIAPLTELLAQKIVSGNVSVNESELQNLR